MQQIPAGCAIDSFTALCEMDEFWVNNSIDMKCGEVFLNSHGNFIMVCTLCELKYKEFEEYSDHVHEKHILCDVLDNEMEMELSAEFDDANSMQSELEEEYKQLEDDSQLIMEEIELLESIEPSLEDLEEYNVMMSSDTVKSIEIYKSSLDSEQLTPTSVKQQIYKCATDSKNEGSKTYYCDECKKGFYSRSGYRSHCRTHMSEPKFHCSKECGQSFFNLKDFRKHMEKCKYECEMQCNDCELVFHDDVTFRKHMEIHERPFKCNKCSVSMKTARGLERHNMEAHAVKQEFICELCSYAFDDQDNLLEHLRTDHPGAPPVKVSIRQTK